MEQRDYLKDQIDQLGRVLGEIVANFLKLKTNGNPMEGLEQSNEDLKEQLDIDIPYLLDADETDVKTSLTAKKMTDNQIETLSDYFKEAGESLLDEDQQRAHEYLQKSKALLDFADELSGAISFQRISKKNSIEQLLA